MINFIKKLFQKDKSTHPEPIVCNYCGKKMNSQTASYTMDYCDECKDEDKSNLFSDIKEWWIILPGRGQRKQGPFKARELLEFSNHLPLDNNQGEIVYVSVRRTKKGEWVRMGRDLLFPKNIFKIQGEDEIDDKFQTNKNTTNVIINKLETRIIKILSKYINLYEDEIKSKTNDSLQEIGIDSLDAVELAINFEDEFNIKISDDDIEKIDTLNDITEYISKSLEKEPKGISSVDDNISQEKSNFKTGTNEFQSKNHQFENLLQSTCLECGGVFDWYSNQFNQMPDCPFCGYNPISSQQNSSSDGLLADLYSDDGLKLNNAAVFLGERGEKRAIEPLMNILKKKGPNTPIGVIGALGNLKVEEAVDYIVEIMPEDDLGPNAHLLGWGTRAIANIGTIEALKTVVNNLLWILPRDYDEVFSNFVSQGEKSLPLLLRALKKYPGGYNKDVELRKTIIRYVGEIGGDEAIEILRENLKDCSWEVCVESANMLDNLAWNPDNSLERTLLQLVNQNGGELSVPDHDQISSLVNILEGDFNNKFRLKAAEILSKNEWMPKNTKQNVRFALAVRKFDTLEPLNDEIEAELIEAMMDSQYHFAHLIPEIIYKSTNKKIQIAFSKILEDDLQKDGLRKKVVEILGKINENWSQELLYKTIKNDAPHFYNRNFTLKCIKSLVAGRSQNAFSLLKKLQNINDKEGHIKNEIERAIVRFK